jgi:hypothetical protein
MDESSRRLLKFAAISGDPPCNFLDRLCDCVDRRDNSVDLARIAGHRPAFAEISSTFGRISTELAGLGGTLQRFASLSS